MAYAPPNEDTVCVVGGLGTQADANLLNGGGATKAAWDAGSPSDFIGTNGGPITSCADATFTLSTKTFSSTGIGTGVTVGTLVSVFGATNVTTGIYEITARTNDTITCNEIDATDDDTNVSLRVGGALSHSGGISYGLQEALDQPLNDGNNYSRYILSNVANSNVDSTINVDTNTGSASTKIYVIGMNSTLTAEASITITCTADIDNLIELFDGKSYYEFRNINFNGGGKDSIKAQYCLAASGATYGQYNTYVNCNFYGAEIDGAYCRSGYANFINCGFYLNGRYGFNSVSSASYQSIFSCSIHDNDNSGLYWRGASSILKASLVYDNGKDGSGSGVQHIGACTATSYTGNDFYGNHDDGIQISSSDIGLVFINNASIGNGAYGYDLQGLGVGDFGYFGHNLAGANTTAHYSGGADNTFEDYANGNNVASSQTADQLLKTITDGSEDFTPETGSDLIDAGLDAQDKKIDIGAIQFEGSGGGGGMLVHPGMSGGCKG